MFFSSMQVLSSTFLWSTEWTFLAVKMRSPWIQSSYYSPHDLIKATGTSSELPLNSKAIYIRLLDQFVNTSNYPGLVPPEGRSLQIGQSGAVANLQECDGVLKINGNGDFLSVIAGGKLLHERQGGRACSGIRVSGVRSTRLHVSSNISRL